MEAARISDYALIGDCETAALVDKAGSISWLCWPRFDSDACFARLLGDADHGFWGIAPVGKASVSRRYLPGTLILETRFDTEEGRITLTDFMPLREGDTAQSNLIRVVQCDRGRVAVNMELAVRFQYGSVVPWMNLHPSGTVQIIAGPHAVYLHASLPINVDAGRACSTFTMTEGDSATFSLTYGASHLPSPPAVDPLSALQSTIDTWRDWSRGHQYDGPWTEAVERSLITIKALTYIPTGGVLAAPTTSLPECIEGERNWDYRYCWLRDSTFTLLSLLNAGYQKEAAAWCAWLLRTVAGSASELQPVYGLSGEPHIPERTLDWLPGYRGSKPVRVGNAATAQLQLDIYGHVMDTLYEARCAGVEFHEASDGLQVQLLGHLGQLWQCKDEGIWEIRSNTQHFVHSKVMCWVAFDRAIRSSEEHGLEGPVDEWRKHRDALRAEILERGFDTRIGAFTQAYGSTQLDAAALLIPIMGFLPATDPRVVSTVEAIERRLMPDGFVLRYDTEAVDDGMPPGEGAFIACTCWLADNYIMQGKHDKAREIFERVLALRNDVGLLAEQYDTSLGMQVGNFPQAFSHFAVIDTAFNFHGEKGAALHEAASVSTD